MATMKGLVKVDAKRGATYREDLPIPVPGPGEILVKVRATAICGTDLHIYEWTPWAEARVPIPMVFGHEFSGDIVELGPGARNFRVGQRVAGETHIGCGVCRQCITGNMHSCEDMKIIGVHTPGAFAEYIAIPDTCAWPLDDNLSYEQGACLEPMGVAMHGLEKACVGGKDIVILGAGPIGAMAVGIARVHGASKIIVSEPVAERRESARRMGATTLISPDKENPYDVVMQVTNGAGADAVLDYSGNVDAIAKGFSLLRKGGLMVLVGLPDRKIQLDLTDAFIFREAICTGVTGRTMYGTWIECKRVLDSGKFDLISMIAEALPLAQYERAFSAMKAGSPGKVLLIP